MALCQDGAGLASTNLAIQGQPQEPDDPMGIVIGPSGTGPASTVNSQTVNIQNNISIVNGQTEEMVVAAHLRAQEADQRRLQAEIRCHQLEMNAEVEKVKFHDLRTEAVIFASKAQQVAQAKADGNLVFAEQALERARTIGCRQSKGA